MHRRITAGLVQQSWQSVFCRVPLTSEKYSGCVGEIFLRRHEPVERVAEEAVAKQDFAAVLLFQPAGGGIHAVSRAPIAVPAVKHIGLAIFEHRNLPLVEGTDRQAGRLGNAAYVGRKPAAAQMIFQKTVDAVHRPPHRPAGNHQVLGDGANHVALFAERGEIDRHAQLFEMGVPTQDDFLRSQGLSVIDDRQLPPLICWRNICNSSAPCLTADEAFCGSTIW